MKKFATVILTALCATAIVSAQPTTAAPIDAQQTAPAQAAAPIDTQPAAEAQTNDAMPIDEQPVPAPKKGNIGIGARTSFIFGNFWGFKDLSDGLDEPSGFGGDFGATLRFDIIDGLNFSPEIAFRFLNLNHEDEEDNLYRSYNQMFIDLAFFMRGSITNTFYLEVGPQISINVHGSYKIDGGMEFEHIEQAPVELGINIGAGYYVLDNLSIGFRWYMGFNEVFPDVKYYYDEDFKLGKDDSSSWSTLNLKGAHTMMYKIGITYWFI